MPWPGLELHFEFSSGPYDHSHFSRSSHGSTMGNACGKAKDVRNELNVEPVQSTPLKSISSKVEPLPPAVKASEQQEEKKGVHWSIPAEATAQQPAATPAEAAQPALLPVVQESPPAQP